MLRVIVVDDEYLVRERVKHCIEWKVLGFEICGEAANGQDAIMLVEKVSPHIIITDINMPYINGLDFSKAIREKQPKTKVVVLTGYPSFDYARAALLAGVSQYVLKPINKNELLDTMLSLKAQIERETQAEQYMERLKNDNRLSFSAYRQQLFQDISENLSSPPEATLLERFVEAYPTLFDSKLIVALIDFHYKTNPMLAPEDYQLWRYAADNIFEEVCGRIAHIEFVNVNGNKVAVLMNLIETDTMEKFVHLCKTAQNYVQEYLGMRTTVGISEECDGFAGVAGAYRQAGRALRQRHVEGCGSVISYKPERKKTYDAAIHPSTDLLIYLRTGNFGAARDEVRHILKNCGNSIDTLYLVLSELVLIINTFVREKEVDVIGIMDSELAIDVLLDQNDDLAGISENIIHIIRQIITRYNQNHLPGYAGLVARTKRYIEENYANKDICLETIAANVSVNPSYLSSVFKKESGFSIVEYLTDYRMKVAERLMSQKGARLAEVADAVGFNDPYYFSKCFKKTFGLAPSNYLKTK